jgi:two-component system NtrC family sensor kinase
LKDIRNVLTEQYIVALQQCINGAGEASLQSAYEIGRQAIDNGLGVLDVAAIHTEAIASLSAESSAPEWLARVEAMGEFLVESLSPFEMTQRGFQEANAALRELNETLEQRVKERTAELESAYGSLMATQEQLLQSAKMAAVGELISGIAHELNNPLTGVMGFTQLLIGMDLGPRSKELAEKVYQQSQRAARIVANLLAFSRKHVPDKTAVSLNQVLQSTVDLRAYDLKVSNIEVQTEFDPKLPLTMADFHALQQVFVNLINNAEQAMKEAKEGETIAIKSEQKEGMIRLTVSNDGPGIPEEKLERIFDAFYTTKPVGMGTGLGLSICHKIVEGHEGKMWAESAEGKGTSFIIELPIVAPERVEEVVRPIVEEGPTKRARILIVDDELPVQELVSSVLEADGHEVHLASNGDAALTCLTSYEYDLIISDIKMPRLGGEELYDQIRSRWPHLAHRVVFSTGDVVADKTRAFLESGELLHITKPFDVNHLRQIVRTALSREEGNEKKAKNNRGRKK